MSVRHFSLTFRSSYKIFESGKCFTDPMLSNCWGEKRSSSGPSFSQQFKWFSPGTIQSNNLKISSFFFVSKPHPQGDSGRWSTWFFRAAAGEPILNNKDQNTRNKAKGSQERPSSEFYSQASSAHCSCRWRKPQKKKKKMDTGKEKQEWWNKIKVVCA